MFKLPCPACKQWIQLDDRGRFLWHFTNAQKQDETTRCTGSGAVVVNS